VHRVLAIVAALSAVALSGCAAPVAGTIVVGVMMADGFRYYGIGPDGKTPYRAPEPDPTRKINVQDCTQTVDPDAGNLMCR
jgi:hypothetical protein